ncbi:MAG: tetratricopeptide repeat protein [Candidatus Micrarchaeota archaeon]
MAKPPAVRRLAPARSEKGLLQRRVLDILEKHPEAVDEYFVGELKPAEKEVVAKTYDDMLERLRWAGLISEPEATELAFRKNEMVGKVRRFVVQSMTPEKNAIDRYRVLLSALGKKGGFYGMQVPGHSGTKEILLDPTDYGLNSAAMHEFIHALQDEGYIRIKNNWENTEPITTMLDNLYLAEIVSGGADRRISRKALDEVREYYLRIRVPDGEEEPRPAGIPQAVWDSEKLKTGSNNNHAEGSADALHILGRALASGMPMRDVWKQAGAFLGAKYFHESDAHPDDQVYIGAYLAEKNTDFAVAAKLYQTLLRNAPAWNREHLLLKVAENYLKARRYTEAISWFSKVDDPFRSNLGIARAHYSLGNFEKAAASAEKATRISPPDAAAYTLLGNAYMELRQYQKAQAAHKKADELSATQP